MCGSGGYDDEDYDGGDGGSSFCVGGLWYVGVVGYVVCVFMVVGFLFGLVGYCGWVVYSDWFVVLLG